MERGMRVLLVEDEHPLGISLSKGLESSGFQVDWIDDGRLVEVSLGEDRYDAVILDLGLPGRSGHQVLQALRLRDTQLPVLVLTARDSLSERVTTLNEGADDFLAKPFALVELEARLAALVRRSRGQERPRFTCGPLTYEPSTRQFSLREEVLSLTPRETALLAALIKQCNKPVTKQQILDRVFGDKDDVMPEAVEVVIHRLRKRLDDRGVRIVTLRGLGYVLEEG
jgi:two-component system response regulator TctD